ARRSNPQRDAGQLLGPGQLDPLRAIVQRADQLGELLVEQRGLGLDQQPLGRGLVVERELEREHPGERIERTLALKQRQLDRAGPTERELASRSRSEERRVGKEGRAGWAPEQEKKKQSSRAS